MYQREDSFSKPIRFGGLNLFSLVILRELIVGGVCLLALSMGGEREFRDM
jgi:hypothetical protein